MAKRSAEKISPRILALETKLQEFENRWQNLMVKLTIENDETERKLKILMSRMERVLSEKIEKSINGPNAWELK